MVGVCDKWETTSSLQDMSTLCCGEASRAHPMIQNSMEVTKSLKSV